MRAIDCEAEVEVAGIDGVDACIALGIGLTIIANHYHLDIGSTIAIVGHSHLDLGTIHGLEPCTPVLLTAAQCASVIAGAPTIVVGTYYGIL